MKNSRKLWFVLLLPGAAFWILDALYSHLFNDHETLIEALVTGLTPRDLVVRLSVLIFSAGCAYLFYQAGRADQKSQGAQPANLEIDLVQNIKLDHARQLSALY